MKEPANDRSPFHEASELARSWRPPLAERLRIACLAAAGSALMIGVCVGAVFALLGR